ncbi:MAG: META domain-containing protein, partial [Eudoraea sp.]
DAANIKFTMIRQIEKVADPIWEIDGEWVVQKLLGEEIDQQGQLPTVIINLNEMRVSGTNGCNNYAGSIKFISSDTFTTGPMASTRKMCMEMTLPDLFDKLFFIPWNYELTSDTFFIKDKDGKELMILKR